MSWVERVKNRIVIVTGDGQTYEPDYIDAQYVQGFNVSEFEFRNVQGTLVKREQPKGRKFQLVILFQGDDHLDVGEQFRQSAFDKRVWRITHPKYDDLIVHPQTLRFDDTDENVTRITGTILETILEVFPAVTENPVDEIQANKTDLDEQTAESYESELAPDPLDSNDANQINDELDRVESNTQQIIDSDEQAAELINLINTARTSVTNGIGSATGFIRDVQTAVNYPFQVEASVQDRINVLIETFEALPFMGVPKNQKKYYETSGSAAISSACVSTVNQLDEFTYMTREDVSNILTSILNVYNDYITNLDEIQTETATEPDSYTPDEESVRQLQDLVNFTVSRLFEVALGARQELILIVSAETDPIQLTHKIYGLDNEDQNLQTLIENNNIGISELLRVPKDREIRYYA